MPDISLRVGAGQLAVVTTTRDTWRGIDGQRIMLDGDDITSWSADHRLDAGLFVTAGRPSPVPGIRTVDLLHRIGSPAASSASDLQAHIAMWCDRLDLASEVLDRHLDAGFSPTEGVAVELLQLAMLEPSVAVIDLAETPTADASRTALIRGVKAIRARHSTISIIIFSNDEHLAAGLPSDHVTTHALTDPTLVQSHRDETMP